VNSQVTKGGAGIDKCKVGLVFPDMPMKGVSPSKDNYQAQMEWVGSVRVNDFANMSGGRKPHFRSSKPPATWTIACQPLASGSAIACRFGRHKGAFRSWTQFNPSKSSLGALNLHFQLMLEQGFKTLMRYGQLTSVEFFADFDGANFSQFCYFDTQLRTANTTYEDDGTVYLGNPRCRRSFCAYDKGKQLQEAFGQVSPSGPRLRVEARLRNAGPLRDIAQLKNPFKTFCVLDRDVLAASAVPSALKLKNMIGWGLSAQDAFMILQPQEQIALINAMPSLQPPWWNAEEVWSAIMSSLGWMAFLSSAGELGEFLDTPDLHPVQAPAIACSIG
jgi:hypothetical protein